MRINNNIFRNETRSYQNKNIAYLLYNRAENLTNIYTDGSFKYTKKNIVGYAFVIDADNHYYIKNGYSIIGKNKYNLGALYAETLAIRKAMEYAYKKKYNNICIYTDNQYIVNAVYNKLVYLNPVLNALINSIYVFLTININFCLDIKYIIGHSNNIGNELANTYAQKGRNKIIKADKLIKKDLDNNKDLDNKVIKKEKFINA